MSDIVPDRNSNKTSLYPSRRDHSSFEEGNALVARTSTRSADACARIFLGPASNAWGNGEITRIIVLLELKVVQGTNCLQAEE